MKKNKMGEQFISDVAFSEAVKNRQEEMGSRAMYQQMSEQNDWQNQITDPLRSFISKRDSFYMASANANGQPYIQHKGGPKGFLKVLDDRHLAFADYSGNRQYISVGNFDENNKVHLFLIDYPNRARMKIWGEVSIVSHTDELKQLVEDADYEVPIERIIKIKVTGWNANCPQHIQQRFLGEEMKQQIDALKNRISELEKEVRNSRTPL